MGRATPVRGTAASVKACWWAGSTSAGAEAADAFQGVEVVAEGVGDRGVVRVLVQADVRGDLGQQMVAGEQAAVARELGRVVLLQVEADVARSVAGRPDRAQAAAGQVEEFAGDDLAVGERGGQPGEAYAGRAVRSGATCSSGAPAAVSLSAMYVNQRSGRSRGCAGRSTLSAACIAIHAPDASRTLPDRPWWSGWWWVITTPWISRRRRTACREAVDEGVPGRRVVPAGVDQDRAAVGVEDVHQRVAEGVVRDGDPDGPYAPAVVGHLCHGFPVLVRIRAPLRSSSAWPLPMITRTGISSSCVSETASGNARRNRDHQLRSVTGSATGIARLRRRQSAMTELVEHGQLFIGGELTDPLGQDVIEVVSPHTEEVIGRVPHASRGRCRPGGRGGAYGLRRGALAADDPRRADRGRHPDQGRLRRTARGVRPRHLLRERLPVLLERPRAGAGLDDGVGLGDHRRARTSRTRSSATACSGRSSCGASRSAWSRPSSRGTSRSSSPPPSSRPRCSTGCTAILKPSPETPLDAYLLAEIAAEAGLPEGVLSILPADREVSEYLVGHQGVDKVSFTGSVGAGQARHGGLRRATSPASPSNWAASRRP